MMKVVRVLLVVGLALSAAATAKSPVIGIFSQPTSGERAKLGSQYMAASYVKFLEAAGARVVPILYNSTDVQLEELFEILDGALYAGGGTSLAASTQYYKASHKFFELAMKEKANGGHFPLWGTCLGFELISIMGANNHSVLEGGFDSENLALPLDFLPEASSSSMFAHAPEFVLSALKEKTTMNNHVMGVTPAMFETNAALRDFFDVLTVNVDRKGRKFVSSIEAKAYPFYGVQWHPEKNSYEFDPNEVIPHSAEAVLVTEYMADFFVNECRKSSHTFTLEDEVHLIYHDTPVYTGPTGSFEQIYVW